MKLDCDLLLFDAVGTLLRPEPSVPEVYHRAGAAAGSRYTVEQIGERLEEVLVRHFASSTRSNRPPSTVTGCNGTAALERPRTDDRNERQRWQRIVFDIFDDLPPSTQQRLFRELWAHFARSDSWRLWEDVRPAWDQLRQRGLALGIASNFDDRLPGICRGLPPLLDADHIFHSANVGYPKPSPEFYQRITDRLPYPRHRIVLVGDDWLHDVVGAVGAGWQAIYLQRCTRFTVRESSNQDLKNKATMTVPVIQRLTDLTE